VTLVLFVLVIAGGVGLFINFSNLKQRVERLEREVMLLRSSAKAALADSVPTQVAEQAQPAVAQPPPLRTEPQAAKLPPRPIPPPLPAPNSGLDWAAIERWIVERWIIAAGGLTAALGGLFIVRYSIEQGLLGPMARIVLGALVGFALIGGAEWVRRRTPDKAGKQDAEQQVPAALSAAGLVTLYGVTYAAYSFYDLVPATIAFALLAAVAFGSLGAGLVYGRLAAVLGAGMGLAAPALVASDSPNAAILFPYLFFVTAGVFALIRYRPWPWLAWLALAGNGIWQLSWMLSVGSDQGTVRVIHLIAVPALSAWLLLRDPWPEPAGPWWKWDWGKAPLPVWTVAATVLGGFGLLWMLAAGTGYDGVAATGWGVGIALLMLLTRWAPTQQPLLAIVGLMTVGLAAAWTVPAMPHDETIPWLVRGPLLAPVLAGYIAPIASYAALFGIGGFALLWRSSQTGLWASVSAAVPVTLLHCSMPACRTSTSRCPGPASASAWRSWP
jgi:uncharacterized membrane protein